MGKEKSSPVWSKTEEELLRKLRPDHTLREIQKAFKDMGHKRSHKAIERKCANLGLAFAGKQKATEQTPDKTAEYDSAWQNILDMKRRYQGDPIETRLRGLTKGSGRKILCLSDFHIPFDRDDLIREAIQEHADADILVLNGDILDLHAVSTWPKEKSIILKKEYDIAIQYMKLFSKFPRVVVIRGNHEFRLNRYFHSNVSPSVSFLVNKEILGRITSGEVYDGDGNVIERLDFSNFVYSGGQEAWFFKIGRTMFVHPQSFSKDPGKTSIVAWEYFMDREDIDSVVVAHTHQQAKLIVRGKLCLETGCMCVPLDYSKQGKLKYLPQTLGYTVVYQDAEGNTDFNRSTTIFKGIQYPMKKSLEELDMGVIL